MFGYSIALHQSQYVNNTILIVGAPNASTFHPNSGAAYLCEMTTQTCEIIKILTDKVKTGVMLGATVTSHKSGKVVVCAPKYYEEWEGEKRGDTHAPIGRCFSILGNFTSISGITPCLYKKWNDGGQCLAGHSAAVSDLNIYLGLPGFNRLQGSCYKDFSAYRYQNPFYPAAFRYYNIYGGYSITYGNFSQEAETIAIGAPRARMDLGSVKMFYANTMKNMDFNFMFGEQYGAYFGYALATVDVDGDDGDDLLISAPMYTRENIENGYETGRVYIFLQNNGFKDPIVLTGYESQSRFGTALCSLGNMNNDEYDDFAIGAPYAGSGKVYIYHGSNVLQNEMKPTQVLEPRANGGIPVQGFGFSLSGGTDVDKNGYPDIAIGALESNQVFIYKARPIVGVDVQMSSQGFISENTTKCTSDASKTPCPTVKACFGYTGKDLNEVIPDFCLLCLYT